MALLVPVSPVITDHTDAARLAQIPAATQPGAAGTFAHTLRGTRRVSPPDAQAQAQKAAGDLVAHALILPVLKQMRRSSFPQGGLFSPGTGEKTFGPDFDMHIAERLAQSPRMHGLTARLADHMLRRGRPAPRTSPQALLTSEPTPGPGVDLNA